MTFLKVITLGERSNNTVLENKRETTRHSNSKHGFPCCQEVCCCNCPGVALSTARLLLRHSLSSSILLTFTCSRAFLVGGDTSVASVLYKAKADMCFLSIFPAKYVIKVRPLGRFLLLRVYFAYGCYTVGSLLP